MGDKVPWENTSYRLIKVGKRTKPPTFEERKNSTKWNGRGKGVDENGRKEWGPILYIDRGRKIRGGITEKNKETKTAQRGRGRKRVSKGTLSMREVDKAFGHQTQK